MFELHAFALETADGETLHHTIYLGILLVAACLLPLITIFLYRRRMLQIRLCCVEMVLLLGCVVMEGAYYYLGRRVVSDLAFHTQDSNLPSHCPLFACCLPIWRQKRFFGMSC